MCISVSYTFIIRSNDNNMREEEKNAAVAQTVPDLREKFLFLRRIFRDMFGCWNSFYHFFFFFGLSSTLFCCIFHVSILFVVVRHHRKPYAIRINGIRIAMNAILSRWCSFEATKFRLFGFGVGQSIPVHCTQYTAFDWIIVCVFGVCKEPKIAH